MFGRKPKQPRVDFVSALNEATLLNERSKRIARDTQAAAAREDIARLRELHTEQGVVLDRMHELARETGAIV